MPEIPWGGGAMPLGRLRRRRRRGRRKRTIQEGRIRKIPEGRIRLRQSWVSPRSGARRIETKHTRTCFHVYKDVYICVYMFFKAYMYIYIYI